MPVPDPPFDRLFNDIKISIPGAIDAVIAQELWRCMEDFLIGTNIWIEEIPFDVSPSDLIYRVTPVGNGSVVRLMMVYDPANAAPDKRWVQGGIAFEMPDRLHLVYAPSSAATWMAVVSKKITDPPLKATLPMPSMDDATWIIDHYRDAFVHGTLAKLFIQPAKPYSSPQLSQFHRQNYITQRGRARTDALHANVYGGQRWMYPQAYATSARKGWT